MKKISLVLLAAVGLTACNQTTKLPPSHYDKLADQPYIESYPLLAGVSLLKQELLFERAVQAYLWALPADGQVWGRPVGVAEGHDGAL